jgi:hypothetical protein
MKSNRGYHYFFKYSLLGGSILLALLAVISGMVPDAVKLEQKPESEDLSSTTIITLVAGLSFLLFLLIRNRFAIVELSNETITIHRKGKTKSISWQDVEQLELLQFVSPPLYTLRTRGSGRTYWFNTEPPRLGMGGFMTDKSEMGKLIEKKKSELGI